jgi:hypothetical protein
MDLGRLIVVARCSRRRFALPTNDRTRLGDLQAFVEGRLLLPTEPTENNRVELQPDIRSSRYKLATPDLQHIVPVGHELAPPVKSVGHSL